MVTDIKKNEKKLVSEYKELLRISYQNLSDEDKKDIRLAFDTAVNAHKDQYRKTGEPYVFHPISVAKIVASEIGLDAASISAALLHDVIEDTKFSEKHIENIFGKTITKIVVGLTKISNLKKDVNISFQAENFRKMLLTLNDDIRVILIKIADRLHNMQTMEAMPTHKQIKISSETLYIYAPLAHRMGLYNIKNELENLSLKYIDNESYNFISKKIKEESDVQDSYIKEFSDLVANKLEKEDLNCVIHGRNKSIYSIYKKMNIKKISYEEIYDKFAIRIIYKSTLADERIKAWQIFSVLTKEFTHNPTRLRDWISTSKSTGYEALHLTVLGPKNKWIEVQIRSERMHEIAEKGYAAHYKYKQNEKIDKIDEWLNYIKDTLQNNNDNALDFVENFKLSLYIDEIFIFTPKGDVKSLPKGSSVLDFAYSIHSQVGNKTEGAKLNGALVPLSTKLKSGDVVEIISSESIKPMPDWLNYVITSKARQSIKLYLNKDKERIEAYGKELFRRKLKYIKINTNKRVINQALHYFSVNDESELYDRVAKKKIDNKAIRSFVNYYNRNFLNIFQRNSYAKSNKPKLNLRNANNEILFGTKKQNLIYSLASCCNPILGDAIFGFHSFNNGGLEVHKNSCKNAIELQSNFAYRMVTASWTDSESKEFIASLNIVGIDTVGTLHQITKLISSDMNINIRNINFNSEDGIFTGKMQMGVKNQIVLNQLMLNIKKIKSINKVVKV